MTPSLQIPQTGPAPGPSGWLPYRWEMLIWLWFAFFFNQADRQVFGSVLPLIKADLHITDVQAGLIASVFTAALAITVPFAGYVGDVFNRARIVTISLFGWSLATLLSGFGSSLGYLIAIRSVATGAGEAFYAPAANALIAEHHAETRARALSIHQTSLYAGVIASGLVSGLIADRFGWRAAFWAFGSAGIILAVFVGIRLRTAAPRAAANVRPPSPRLTEVFSVLRRPTVMLLATAWGCMVFVNIGYMTWMPTYLHEQFGLNLANAGYSSMVYHHVGAFAGVIVGGILSDRLAVSHPQRRLFLQGAALFAGAPFIWMLGTQSGPGVLFAALAGFGLFRGVYDAGIYASLFEVIEPRLRATALGFIIALVYLFGAIAPVLLGALKGQFGLSFSFSLLALVYVTGGIAATMAGGIFFARDQRLAIRL
ncbi:MAG: MFS transporter [Opitutaceae bacterium]